MRRERNVFDDLGFSPEEATALTMKAELHSKIILYAKTYSQAQLQEMLGEPQPRISERLRAQGLSLRAIGRSLGISEGSVRRLAAGDA